MGVRNGAAARARDQADPGQLGRRWLGARRGRARPEPGAARCLSQAGQGMTGGDDAPAEAASLQSAEERLAALGLTLPPVVTPLAAYVPAVRSGNTVYTAGQLPMADGRLLSVGKVGAEVGAAEAAVLARTCALNALAAAASVAGGVSGISRIVKLTGFVASAPDFTGQPQVVNGASELLLEIFGEAGRHARSAVGVAVLPLNAPVEIELTVEVRD